MSTAVFVAPTGRRIQPFDDPVTETPIANRPLSAWQADAFRDAGLTLIDTLTPPCLVVPDTLFTTGDALRAFIDGAAGRDAVFVLADSRYGKSNTPVQPGVVERPEGGWRFEAIRYVTPAGGEPVDVVVDPGESPLDLPAPPYLREETIEIGIVRDPVMTLHHWVHILWANQAVGGIELLRTPKWKWVARGLMGVLKARSFNKWKVLQKSNTIGKNCDIHPTAVVEGCTLGDNVVIGPFCRVLFSTLGDGVSLMPGAQVELCTLGDRATVSEMSVLRFSVVYPEGTVGQYLMQQCVIGRQALTTAGAFSIDLNFEQGIRVPLDGTLYDTGQRFLGSAFGHRCRIGTGFWMASGRMVPNDYFLVRDPAQVLAKLPPDLPTDRPLAASGRTLIST